MTGLARVFSYPLIILVYLFTVISVEIFSGHYVLAENNPSGDVSRHVTVRLEKYGIGLTLPDRWKIKEIDEKAYERKEKVIILSVEDMLGKNDVTLYMRDSRTTQKSITNWVDKQVPWILSRYSAGHESSKKTIVGKRISLETGEDFSIEYHALEVDNKEKEFAIAYFLHNKFFFLFVVENTNDDNFEKKLFVEQVLFNGLKLF